MAEHRGDRGLTFPGDPTDHPTTTTTTTMPTTTTTSTTTSTTTTTSTMAPTTTTTTTTPSEGNRAPLARRDRYRVDREAVLAVGAPGVLANDWDRDEDSLSAIEGRTEPRHGTLVLNPDGSFTYTPDAGFAGIDRFTYVAFDGKDRSREARVAITVGNRKKGSGECDRWATNDDRDDDDDDGDDHSRCGRRGVASDASAVPLAPAAAPTAGSTEPRSAGVKSSPVAESAPAADATGVILTATADAGAEVPDAGTARRLPLPLAPILVVLAGIAVNVGISRLGRRRNHR